MPQDNTLPEPQTPPARLGILISSNAADCLAIAAAIRAESLAGCEVAVVVSNMTGAPGIEAARTAGLPVVVMEGRGREQRDHENAVSTLLRTYRVDLVCMAGYSRALSAGFIRDWRGRILSIHPSLLPAFPGYHAAEQALGYGVHYTGCTVHFVEEALDSGAIVVQRVVEVAEDDTAETLAARIVAEQRSAYPEAIRRVLSGDYERQGRRYLLREDLRYPYDGLDTAEFAESAAASEPRSREPAVSGPAASA